MCRSGISDIDDLRPGQGLNTSIEGGRVPPSGFSQIFGKRRPTAPPYLAHLIPHQFHMSQQNFEVRSYQVTELFKVT